jgi:eukaryotic-like serine/threonine-protein kinase
MSLQIGQQLASYEITSLIGKGGMGEVYGAKDTKLKRDVAIKILPDEFSRDGDRISRFQRQAKSLAVLNSRAQSSEYRSDPIRFTVLAMEVVDRRFFLCAHFVPLKFHFRC